MKTLVLFVYYDYNTRVHSFLKNAIFLDKDVDFMIIDNSEEAPPMVPEHVIYFNIKGAGYDFGGWSRALLYNDLYKEYDNFIFVNSTAVGPFLPSYVNEKWTDIYINGLKNGIKLFGSTISTESINLINDPEGSSHVQSYIFAMDLEVLMFLIKNDIFSLKSDARTLPELRLNKEIKMSRLILERGWNIGCLMKYYNGVDFRFLTTSWTDYKPFLGDVMTTKNFSDKLFNNFFELVFIKGSRFDNNIHGIKLT